MIKNLLLVGLGGFIGSILRYLSYFISKQTPAFFTTCLINILGSLLIGMVIGLNLKGGFLNNNWKLFISTGVCGGFTTFSTFSMENIQLIQQGKIALSIIYVMSSIFFGILAAFIGFKLTS